MLAAAGVESGAQEEVLDRLTSAHERAGLEAADRAMLDYAVKLTRTPSATAVDDVDHLREQGFEDRAIHDICAITAYFAFVNRIADGLGVELEDQSRK